MGKIYLTALAILVSLNLSNATTTINYGDELTAYINALGELHNYSFDATAGDKTLLQLRGISGGVDVCMELFDPSGTSIGEACDDGGILFFDGLLLESIGTHTIATHDCDNNDTGEYGLSLSLLNNPQISDCPVIPDTTPPSIAGCSDFTITSEELNNGTSTDFYENWITQVTAMDTEGATRITHNFDPNSFSCLDGISGVQRVLFTATDESNNTTTCEAIITVIDNALPIPTLSTLPDISVDCEITVQVPTATNHCNGELIYGVTYDEMSFNTVGSYTINWIYIDINGSASYQEQTVTVTNIAEAVFSTAVLPTISADSEVEIEAPTGVPKI